MCAYLAWNQHNVGQVLSVISVAMKWSVSLTALLSRMLSLDAHITGDAEYVCLDTNNRHHVSMCKPKQSTLDI